VSSKTTIASATELKTSLQPLIVCAKKSNEPLHQVMEKVAYLTDDQLIVLIDQAREQYRDRQGFGLERPRRRSKKPAS
jgi:ribosomal protein L17